VPLGFTLALSLVAAVLSGLAPAFHGSRAEVVGGLKADAQGGPERLRLRNAFVISQVAFSIVLVVGAGLFVRALQRASQHRSRLRFQRRRARIPGSVAQRIYRDHPLLRSRSSSSSACGRCPAFATRRCRQ
jgi:hypothetical protein